MSPGQHNTFPGLPLNIFKLHLLLLKKDQGIPKVKGWNGGVGAHKVDLAITLRLGFLRITGFTLNEP